LERYKIFFFIIFLIGKLPLLNFGVLFFAEKSTLKTTKINIQTKLKQLNEQC